MIGTISGVAAFAALANAAHDLWAATIVYAVALGLASVLLFKPAVRTVLLLPLFIVLVVFSLSFAQSVNPAESLLELLDWIACALLFVVTINVFTREKAVEAFLAVGVGVLWVETALLLFQKVQMGWLRLLIDYSPGSFVNAAVGAGYMLLWIPPLLKRSIDRRSLFWWSGTVCALVCLAIFASTLATIFLLIGLPLYFGWNRLRMIWRERPVLAGGVLIAVAAAIACLLWVKFSNILVSSGLAIARPQNSRIDWWMSALAMLLDNPFLGVGIGNFPSAYAAYRVGHSQGTLYAHGTLFTLLGETGILGMGALITLAAAAAARIKADWTAVRQRSDILAGLVLFVFFSWVSISAEFLVNLMAGFLFLGILLAPATAQQWRPRRSIAVVVAAVSLAALSFLASMFVSSQNFVAGWGQLLEGRYAQAAKSFQSARELNPLSSEAWQGAALTAFARGDAEEAVTFQEKAVSLNKLNWLLWWELGRYSVAAGRWEQAEAAFRNACDLNGFERTAASVF